MPVGAAIATAAAAMARPTLTMTWSTVAGVSGVPKHPQLEMAPPRCRAKATKAANPANERATNHADPDRGKRMATQPSTASATEPTLTSRRVPASGRRTSVARARAVSVGCTALAAPAATRRVQATR